MTAFTFNTTKSVICEPGVTHRLGQIVKEHMGKKVLLVTDPGLVKAGLLDVATNSLNEAGVKYELFDGVVADPPVSVVEAALADAREAGVDVLTRGAGGDGGAGGGGVARRCAVVPDARRCGVHRRRRTRT